MKKIKELLIKYKEVIMYLIFGVLTTIINIVTYYLFSNILNINYLVSNALAWILSVIFAYITNKIYVFESNTNKITDVLKEITSFVGFRVVSGLIDMGFMYITVSLLLLNDTIMKILSNVVVVILNYVFSKLFIFKKDK